MRLSEVREQTLQYWRSMDEARRAVSIAAAAAFLFGAGWGLVWRPISGRAASLATAVERNESRLETMKASVSEIEELRAKAHRSAAVSPLTALENNAARQNVRGNIRDLSQDSDGAVSFVLESVHFRSLVLLVDGLRSDGGFRVERAQIETQAGPGLVTARLTFH